MKLYRTFAAVVLAAVAAAANPAAAANITADPQIIAAVLEGEGLEVKVGADSDGNPRINATFGENQAFSVYFYGCTNASGCDSLQLYAGYTESASDSAKLMEWNRTRRYGRAYLDSDGEPAIEMDVSLREGGMSRELFIDNMQTWRQVMSAFSEYIYG